MSKSQQLIPDDQRLLDSILEEGVDILTLYRHMKQTSSQPVMSENKDTQMPSLLFTLFSITFPHEFNLLCTQVICSESQEDIIALFSAFQFILLKNYMRGAVLHISIRHTLHLLRMQNSNTNILTVLLGWVSSVVKNKDILMATGTALPDAVLGSLFPRNIFRSRCLCILYDYFDRMSQFDCQYYCFVLGQITQVFQCTNYFLQRKYVTINSVSAQSLAVFDELMHNLCRLLRMGAARIEHSNAKKELICYFRDCCLYKLSSCYEESLKILKACLFQHQEEPIPKENAELLVQVLDCLPKSVELVSTAQNELQSLMASVYQKNSIAFFDTLEEVTIRLFPVLHRMTYDDLIHSGKIDMIENILVMPAKLQDDFQSKKITSSYLKLRILRICMRLLNLADICDTTEKSAKFKVSIFRILANYPNFFQKSTKGSSSLVHKLVINNICYSVPLVLSLAKIGSQHLSTELSQAILSKMDQVKSPEDRISLYQALISNLEMENYNNFADYAIVNSIGLKNRGAEWKIDFELMYKIYEHYEQIGDSEQIGLLNDLIFTIKSFNQNSIQ